VNKEVEGIWKEVVVATFNLVYQHMSGETELNHENQITYFTRVKLLFISVDPYW
jgi:hypothetical protein